MTVDISTVPPLRVMMADVSGRRTYGAVLIALLSVGAHAQDRLPRHELRFGSDTDTFNYTDAATAQAINLTSRWNSRWTTSFAATSYQRFGADAYRLTARVSRKIGNGSWISLGGGGGHDEAVIPKRETSFEIGHAHRIPGKHFIRGIEVAYGQQWLWFAGSKVLVLSESNLLYLPRDWMLTVAASGARASFHVPQIDWTPSGSARLSIPLHPRLRANFGFAVGTENFAKVDELGRFSARTYTGGVRFQFSRTQDIGAIVAFQQRTAGRTQTSVGVSYGIRF